LRAESKIAMGAELERMIAKVRALGTIAEDTAPKVAIALVEVLSENIAAARGPGGRAWQLKQDGGAPLRNAARALSAAAEGTVALVRLTGPEVLHHLGAAKGRIRRQILPGRKLDAPAVEAIRRVVDKRFAEIKAGNA
jgi:hypothetical protein